MISIYNIHIYIKGITFLLLYDLLQIEYYRGPGARWPHRTRQHPPGARPRGEPALRRAPPGAFRQPHQPFEW
jgi:hypothetical protein